MNATGKIRNRKLNRFKGYDYSRDWCYFVTVYVKDRRECLGDIVDEKMVLNQ